MKKIILALSFLLSTQAIADAGKFELKGVTIGDQYEAMDLSLFDCKTSLLDKDAAQCSAKGHVTIAEHPVKMRVMFHKGKVDTIAAFFHHDAFEDVRAGLMGKFGKPALNEVNILSNSFGAQFESNEITWMHKSEVAYLKERVNKVDESAIHITTNASTDRYTARKRKEQAERAKDL
jgi:hypothetical protein